MAKSAIIDELHITFRVSGNLTSARTAAIRRVLNRSDFLARLRRAVRGVIRDSELKGAGCREPMKL